MPWSSRLKTGVTRAIAEVLPPTLFFVVGANTIKALVRLAYAPDTLTAWKTLIFSITAIVTAKAIILLDILPLMKRLDDRPLIQPIFFRGSLYFLAICLLRGAEFLWRERLDVGSIVGSMSDDQWDRTLALNGWIFILCLLYAFIGQINHLVGGRLMRELFVSRSYGVP